MPNHDELEDFRQEFSVTICFIIRESGQGLSQIGNQLNTMTIMIGMNKKRTILDLEYKC